MMIVPAASSAEKKFTLEIYTPKYAKNQKHNRRRKMWLKSMENVSQFGTFL